MSNLDLDSAEGVVANLRVLGALDRLTGSSLTALRGLYKNPNPMIAVEAISAALPSGKPADLETFADFLERVDPAAVASAITVRTFRGLADARDPAALAALERLSLSSHPTIRLDAITAIRKSRDPRSVPFLVGLLNQTNVELQYAGIITLAEITGSSGEGAPNMEVFERSPVPYVALWKTWWETKGKKQYGVYEKP